MVNVMKSKVYKVRLGRLGHLGHYLGQSGVDVLNVLNAYRHRTLGQLRQKGRKIK